MTLDEIKQELERRLPDNDQGLITPADLRAIILLLLDAIKDGVDS